MTQNSTINRSQDPIDANIKRLAAVIGKEMTGPILASLYTRPFQSASDIARIYGIHIATAQKYLKEMKECGLVQTRIRRSATRPTQEYWIAQPKISINIDFECIESKKDLELEASKTLIRTARSGLIAYESDNRTKTVTEILLLEGRDRPRIGRRLKLDDVQGKFAWHLPLAGEDPRTVLEVLEDAHIDPSELPTVMNFVDKLSSLGIARQFPKKDESKKKGR